MQGVTRKPGETFPVLRPVPTEVPLRTDCNSGINFSGDLGSIGLASNLLKSSYLILLLVLLNYTITLVVPKKCLQGHLKIMK